MNKDQLATALAEETGTTKAQAAENISALTKIITNTLKQGDSLSLVGFGTFSSKERAARKGRNPRTGEEIQIAAARVPNFKAGKSLKEAVNK